MFAGIHTLSLNQAHRKEAGRKTVVGRYSVKRWILYLMLSYFVTQLAAAADDLEPYTLPDRGFTRMVFRVPAADNEANRMVEIIVGKAVLVDCNRHWFMGNLDKHTVQGWGYPYYRIDKVSGPATTLKACPEGQEKKEAFVQVQGEGLNSATTVNCLWWSTSRRVSRCVIAFGKLLQKFKTQSENEIHGMSANRDDCNHLPDFRLSQLRE